MEGGGVAGKTAGFTRFSNTAHVRPFLPYFSLFQALKQQQQRNQRRQGGMPTSQSPRLLLKTIKDMSDTSATKTGRWQLLYCQMQYKKESIVVIWDIEPVIS